MRTLPALLVLLSVAYAARADAATACAAQSGAETVPLVELYTSEGCSSCPPADRWLSQRFAGGEANFLAFHVDYWDAIGWPDRFATPGYSQRQRERVRAAAGATVYTPQLMVGATVRANWRNDLAWQRTLVQARRPARASLALRLRRTDSGWQADLAAAPSGGREVAEVWLARYLDGQTTAVHAGENRGATLRHDRVVRGLSGPWPLGAAGSSRSVTLPEEAGAWGVTAFVQDAQGDVLQSLNLHVAGCAALPARSQADSMQGGDRGLLRLHRCPGWLSRAGAGGRLRPGPSCPTAGPPGAART